MTAFFQGLVLGAVQGITEWLPISSEGINTLILLHFFHRPLDEAILVSIWLHTGTVLAALIYFRRDVLALVSYLPKYVRELRAGSGTEPGSLITFLIVSTVLTGVIGAPLMVSGLSQISIPADLVTAIIGALLIITGVVLKYAPRSAGMKTTAGIKDAIVLGVVQAFSIFPGLSRSGLTVSALLFRGIKVNYALRISFLMSIPLVLAAEVGLALMNKISFNLLALGGILTAFLFGILTIGTLMRIATRIAFWKFCLFLGGLSLLPLLIASL